MFDYEGHEYASVPAFKSGMTEKISTYHQEIARSVALATCGCLCAQITLSS